jgi:hypothetical protein
MARLDGQSCERRLRPTADEVPLFRNTANALLQLEIRSIDRSTSATRPCNA